MIAEVTALALKQVLSVRDLAAHKGAYHLAASGETNWHGFASSIIGLMPETERKCKVVEPIVTSEYLLPAKRPTYSVLSCEKLKRAFGLQLPHWEESLKQVLEKS
jgi:dTDP-4-dehydrorhamnose reductase